MISGNRGGKKHFLPTQRYDILSERARKWFVVTLAVDTDVIQNRQWNAERAIFFSDGYFSACTPGLWNKNIRDHITSCVNLWNKGAYHELVHDSYRAPEDYLGKAHGNQTQDQHRRTFSNLIIRGKLCEAFRFIFEWETGRVLLPDDQVTDRTGFMDKTVV